ncbi:hypothetical protein [Sporosarcina sp. P26b]|nr:hypothetical protein [Sporosarcina sp. P26b]
MAEVEQKLVIVGPKTWQGWYNPVAIFTYHKSFYNITAITFRDIKILDC